MRNLSAANMAIGILVVAVVFLFFRTSKLSNSETGAPQLKTRVAQLQDSLLELHLSIDRLKSQMPGLGEYMTTIQLHTAKLWFAAQASNWELTRFELDELEETIEAAERVHAMKNNVDISSVLHSFRLTQLAQTRQATDAKDLKTFRSAYTETLETCNGCHRAAGFAFIHIITPVREPVTNQKWAGELGRN